MKVTVATKVSRDRRGRKGAKLHLTTESGARWHARYSISAHGLTTQEIRDRIKSVEAHHAKIEQRLDEMAELRASTLRVRGRDFGVVDTRLLDIGEPGGDMELWIRVRDENGALMPEPWFPMVIVGHEISLPKTSELESMIRKRINDALQDAEDDDATLVSLRQHETPGGR